MARRELNQLKSETREREAYLDQINKQIEHATEEGSMAIRDLSMEVEALNKEKARLTKQLLVIRQEIREAKLVKSSL